MVRALSKGDISMNFNETEKFSILSGMDVFVPAIAMGAIGISHMWYKVGGIHCNRMCVRVSPFPV